MLAPGSRLALAARREPTTNGPGKKKRSRTSNRFAGGSFDESDSGPAEEPVDLWRVAGITPARVRGRTYRHG